MAISSLTITNANAVVGGKIRNCNIRIEEGIITGILPPGEAYGRSFDVKGHLVVPGFIDVHTHGGGGIDFTSAEPRDVRSACDFYASHGVTGVYPTLSADSEETLLRSVIAINKAKTDYGLSQIFGIHLEGPFLNPDYAGAQPKAALTDPNYRMFCRIMDASGQMVNRITLAPELDGAIPFIKRVSDEGCCVSLGHSGADAATVRKAIENGATSGTHLFNAMVPMTHHAPGIVGELLASNAFCEVICDGVHVDPVAVKFIYRAKGARKMVVVTDSISPAGLPEGLYKTGFGNAVSKGMDLKLLENGVRVGSLLTMDNALKNLIGFTGESLENCLIPLTEAPARMMGIFSKRGSIDIGKYADLAVLTKEYDILATMSEGNLIYQA